MEASKFVRLLEEQSEPQQAPGCSVLLTRVKASRCFWPTVAVALIFVVAALAIIVLCIRGASLADVTSDTATRQPPPPPSSADEHDTIELQLKATPATSAQPAKVELQLQTPASAAAAVAPQTPPPQGPACYQSNHIDRDRIAQLLPDILAARPRPAANGSNFFFHDTRCRYDGIATLSVREACAIESAARANRRSGVFVLFASPVGHVRTRSADQNGDDVFAALAKYANVHLRTVDLWRYAAGTPAADFMRGPQLFGSAHLEAHVSDALRLLSLYRWGGTHMDLDFVVRKSFEPEPESESEGGSGGGGGGGLPANYVGEFYDLISGVMHFASDAGGRRLTTELVRQFVRHYNGQQYTANGAALLRRVFGGLCDDLHDCAVVRVLPKSALFEVAHWQMLFDPADADEAMGRLNDSMAVHMFNEFSSRVPVRLGEGAAYERLARQFCPEVLATVGAAGEF